MNLFFAARKTWNELRICDAIPGNPMMLSSCNPSGWINAAREDWDFLDQMIDGRLYDKWELVACPPDMGMTPETSINPQ